VVGGRPAPDFETLADVRAENAAANKNVCREFIVLCRHWGLFTEATVAIDGSSTSGLVGNAARSAATSAKSNRSWRSTLPKRHAATAHGAEP
jgi:hypothetical protein